MIRGVVAAVLLAPMILASKQLPDADPGDRCMVAVEFADPEEAIEPEIVPEPETEVIQTAAEPQGNLRYYSNCRLTFYCGGSCCCGQWAGGGTASGTTPTPGRTVANGSLPFGTRVMIEGHEYTVEDRGVGGDQFDIFVSSHDEALARGLYYADVWIIE